MHQNVFINLYTWPESIFMFFFLILDKYKNTELKQISICVTFKNYLIPIFAY